MDFLGTRAMFLADMNTVGAFVSGGCLFLVLGRHLRELIRIRAKWTARRIFEDSVKLFLAALLTVLAMALFFLGTDLVSDYFGATGMERSNISKFLMWATLGVCLVLWVYFKARAERRLKQRLKGRPQELK